jgi:hypothetical protein
VRTTVTLDDDLAAALKRRSRERDIPFKQAINETIRAGLSGGATAAARPYRMKPRNLEVRPGVDLTKALALAGELEDEDIVRKLEQGR